jgi:uncharacterized membrane protein YfcA
MPSDSFLLSALLPVLGLVVGVYSSFTGLGGGMIMTPALSLAFGLSYPDAVACTVAQMAAMSASGLWHHWRLGHIDWKLAGNFVVGSVPGAVVGRLFLEQLARHCDERVLRTTFNLIFAAVLAASAISMLMKAARWYRRPDARKAGTTGSAPGARRQAGATSEGRGSADRHGASGPRLHAPVVRAVTLGVAGVGAGVLAGLLSLGGGVVAVPVLVGLLGVRPTVAVGTSVFQMAVMSVAASVVSLKGTGLDGTVIGLLLAGSIPGAALGPVLLARLTRRFGQNG